MESEAVAEETASGADNASVSSGDESVSPEE
jgi:hypothetical protein